MKYIFNFFMISIILTASCTPKYIFNKPDGFAEYKIKNDIYKAISSDGIKIKVYFAKNEPYGEASMWMESTDSYLKGIGYTSISSDKVVAESGKSGICNEYKYLYYGRVYEYIVSIFIDKDNIYIIEASGLEKYFNKRKEAILNGIKKFKING